MVELILRGLVVYAVLFVLMRASGSRQFAQMTAFDAVLVILVAEVTGQALVGEDYSLTAAIIVLTTIVGFDVAVSLLKHRFKGANRVLEGVSVLLIDNGRVQHRVFDKERIELQEVLEEARLRHGLERLDQIKFAVLEPGGDISIVPKARGRS